MNQRTRHIQERVDEIYMRGEYERALLIYEKELAPLGDKYAQYMVGYMHLNAQGTPRDEIAALAWYRLAAERGERLLEHVRDELQGTLTPAAVAASDQLFLALWKEMGDRKLILELIQRDMSILKRQTGSRIPGSTVSGAAMVYGPAGESLGPNFYRDVRTQLEARLAYLDTTVEISDIVVKGELERIRSIEAGIKQELAAFENR